MQVGESNAALLARHLKPVAARKEVIHMNTISNKQAFFLGLFFGLGFAVASVVIALVPALVAGLGGK